jgi:hypothetical protein
MLTETRYPIETHRLDKLLGPAGSFGGLVVLIIGLVALYQSFSAIFLILVGSFAAFTETVTSIDYSLRRVRHGTAWFGIIKSGTWIDLDNSMTLRVRPSGRSYTSYSRSNRMFSLRETDFSIVLKDSRGKEICPLHRFKSRSEAESQLLGISVRLGIPASQ